MMTGMELNDLLVVVRKIAVELRRGLAAIDQEVSASGGPDLHYSDIAALLDQSLNFLWKLDVWGPENRLPSSEIWNAAGEFLSRGWLQNQARTKPRGYAGDYEMLARIYDNVLCD